MNSVSEESLTFTKQEGSVKLLIIYSLDCTEYRNLVAQLHRGIEILLHVCTNCTHAYDSDRRAPGPVRTCTLICLRTFPSCYGSLVTIFC